MDRVISGLVCSLLSFISGTALHPIELGPIGRLQNPIWGTVYGMGWFSATSILGHPSKIAGIFGSIVWPLFVSVCVYYFAKSVWQHGIERKRMLFPAIFVLSFFVVAPLETVAKFPLFFKFLY